MKRSLWFDASMLVLILIVSTVASTLDRASNHRGAAVDQRAPSTQGGVSSLR